MKKRLLALAMGTMMIASLTACGDKEEETKEKTEAVFTIGEYKGLEVQKSTAEITDEELKERIDGILDSKKTTEYKEEGTTAAEDKITAVYTASIDGEKISALSSSDSGSTVTLKDGSFLVSGFIENLIGKKVGDVVEFDVTIPKDTKTESLKTYAGKSVHYNVTIKNIVIVTVPELTDEWVKENYSYLGTETVEAFKEYHRNSMRKSDIYAELYEQLLAIVDVTSYDSEELDYWTDYYFESFKNQLSYYGIALDAYYQALDKDEDDLKEDCENDAKEYLRMKMCMTKIAELEGITLTDEEYANKLLEAAKDYGYDTAAELESAYEGIMTEDDFRYAFIADKVQEFICDNITEIPDKEESKEDESSDDSAEDKEETSEEGSDTSDN